MGRVLASICLAVAINGLAGCDTGRRLAWGASVPGQRVAASVQRTDVRGPYLVSELASDVFRLRLVFPDEPRCRALLAPEASVDYTRIGLFGHVSSGDARCDAVGVASLAAWRDQRSRSEARARGVPRSQATFAVISEDAELVLVRGRFPRAADIGFTGTDDLIAMLRPAEACRRALAAGVASMESRPAGTPALSLVGEAGRCPIEALALPR